MRNQFGHLLFFNVDRGLARFIAADLPEHYQVEVLEPGECAYIELQSRIASIDAVLVGPEITDPVGVGQRIHSLDKRLPIIILSRAAQCGQLRKALMFSPFLGYEVLVWPTTDISGLIDVLVDSAQRRRQRQRYQEAWIANAHVQLEVLPLLQPETAEYVEGLLDNQPIGILAAERGGKTLTLNRRARQLLAVKEPTVVGRSALQLFPKAERGRIKEMLLAASESGGAISPEIFELVDDRGQRSFVEVTASGFVNRSGMSGVMLMLQDVTLRINSERQRTEAVVELRQIATVLRAFHAISIGNSGNPKSTIRKFLQLGCEQLGMPIGLLTRIDGQQFYILEAISNDSRFSAGHVTQVRTTFCAATIGSFEPIAIENASAAKWRHHPAFKENHIEAYIGVRIIVGGSVFGTLCFMDPAARSRPFTSAERETLKIMSQWIGGELQRERAEAHMRKLSSAIEQAADSVIIMDPKGIVEYVNPSFELLTGYSSQDVVGRPASFLGNDEKMQDRLWETVEQESNYRFLLNGRNKAGGTYHAQVTINKLKDDTGTATHLIATGQDVTALVLARETNQKRQAEITHVARLSTLGGMVSGLAHELNQPLCAIVTYAQTCLRKTETGTPDVEDLRHGLTQIVRQAERANDIFVRIRGFSRKREMKPKKTDIRDIIESSVNLIETELHNNRIDLELRLAAKPRYVIADAIHIQQVLVNLLRNSIDAITAAGEDKRMISLQVGTGGRSQTKVAVSDTGTGCPRESLHRLFEPFFTTKEAGLGVGLSISQEIVEAHGGKLWLDSTSGGGATFCFTLPNYRRMDDGANLR